MFQWPFPTEDELIDRYAKSYYGEKASYDNTNEFINKQIIANHLLPLGVGPNSRVLDYGCGEGKLVHLLKEHFKEAIGFDKYAPQVSGLHSSMSEIQGNFDLIILNEVVEHLQKPWSVISELLELVNPKGKLWFSTPNFSGLSSVIKKSSWCQMQNPTHLYYFTPASIKNCFKGNDRTIHRQKTNIAYSKNVIKRIKDLALQASFLDGDMKFYILKK